MCTSVIYRCISVKFYVSNTNISGGILINVIMRTNVTAQLKLSHGAIRTHVHMHVTNVQMHKIFEVVVINFLATTDIYLKDMRPFHS